MLALSIPLGSDVALAEDDCGFDEHPGDNATMSERKRIRSLTSTLPSKRGTNFEYKAHGCGASTGMGQMSVGSGRTRQRPRLSFTPSIARRGAPQAARRPQALP